VAFIRRRDVDIVRVIDKMRIKRIRHSRAFRLRLSNSC